MAASLLRAGAVDRLIVMRGFEDMAGPGDEDAAIRFLETTARELSLGRAA